MSPESQEESNVLDLSLDIEGALAKADEEGEDDEDLRLDHVHSGGLESIEARAIAQAEASGELPYVYLLKAAVSMVKTGDLSMEEYVEGVTKLDKIADNALKVYAIPAVKNDLPGKLTDHQNVIVGSLEDEILRMKEGLGILLSYPETQAIGDLEVGLETAVSAMNAMADIQQAADTEHARIMQEVKDDKARRAQKAAEAEAES